MATYPILEESDRIETGEFRHRPCGELLDVQVITHPVHFAIWGGAPIGGGDVELEYAPYCATCGEAPSQYGAPVMR